MAGPAEYACLTEKLVTEWRSKQAVPKVVQSAFQAAVAKYLQDPSQGDGLVPTLKALLNEACWRVVNGFIDKVLVVPFLESVLQPADPDGPLAIALTDVLWGISLEVRGAGGDNDEYAALCLLVSALGNDVISSSTLKGILDDNLIQSVGLVTSIEEFNTKIKKRNTDLVYRQRKFNLLREETEGFAKLLVLLLSADNATSDSSTSAAGAVVTDAQSEAATVALRRKTRMLMGYFDLDPNRCYDLVLGALEAKPDCLPLLRLLGDFRRAALPHVLGFKFAHYRRDEVHERLAKARIPRMVAAAVTGSSLSGGSAAAVTEVQALAASKAAAVTPPSLYRLAATLVAGGVLELDSLLAHLAPPLQVIQEEQAAFDEAMVKEIARPGYALEAAIAVAKRSAQGAASHAGIALAKQAAQGSSAGRTKDGRPIDSDAAARVGGAEAVAALQDNQVLGLLVAALDADLWTVAQNLLAKLRVARADLSRHAAVRTALARAAHSLLNPMYSPNVAMMDLVGARGRARSNAVAAASKDSNSSASGLRKGSTLSTLSVREEGEADEIEPALPAITAAQATADAVIEVGELEWWQDSDLIGSDINSSANASEDADGTGTFITEDSYVQPSVKAFDIQAIDALEPILDALELGLADEPALFFKLCRVLSSSVLRFHPPAEVRARFLVIVERHLLPALELMHYNAAAAMEVWSVIKEFGYEERYDTYRKWLASSLNKQGRHWRLLVADAQADRDVKLFSKQVNAAVQDDNHAVRMAKITHAHPLSFDYLLQMVEKFDNFVNLLVDTSKHMTALSFDVCTYFIASRLSLNKDLVSESGLLASPWLSNLANFAGHFYKRMQMRTQESH